MTSTKTRASAGGHTAPNPNTTEPGGSDFESAKLATYVQLTEVDAEVPEALQHLVAVGRLAFQEKISVAAFQEVLDAVWLYGPVDANVILGIEVAPPAEVATGATEGAPGTFTPPGSIVPADAAALALVLANPTTLWALGNYVVTVDAVQSYWDGTAWVGGTSPGPVEADDQKASKKATKK